LAMNFEMFSLLSTSSAQEYRIRFFVWNYLS